MDLADARHLKSRFIGELLTEVMKPAILRTLGVRARSAENARATLRSIAVGIARVGAQHQVALRIQRSALLDHPLIERFRKTAARELDVRFIGRIEKRETPATLQKRRRPLVIGCSIGHVKVTAGTLGCFVKRRSDGATLILSNNHVLANENRARKGDSVIQPGDFDGGIDPTHRVADLDAFVRLKVAQANRVDAALAKPLAAISLSTKKLGAFGTLKGLGPDFLDKGTVVHKVGRTTGETTGQVTAFELDNVVVSYDIGDLRFDDQVEIEGSGADAFSDGGDSGSLIFDDDRKGVALLFAGGDVGGSNGKGLTYANPLRNVLDALKVDLLA